MISDSVKRMLRETEYTDKTPLFSKQLHEFIMNQMHTDEPSLEKVLKEADRLEITDAQLLWTLREGLDDISQIANAIQNLKNKP